MPRKQELDLKPSRKKFKFLANCERPVSFYHSNEPDILLGKYKLNFRTSGKFH